VAAKAGVKLFVFSGDNAWYEDTVIRLQCYIKSFEPKDPDERYVASCFSETTHEFQHQVFDGVGQRISLLAV